MITFQDFQAATDKKEFILESIKEFKNSDMYLNAIDAQAYYNGQNTTILNRKPMFYNSQGVLVVDKFKSNNQVCNEFFPKIVKQENSYLLSNGVTTDEKIDEVLGNRFDVKLQLAGLNALIDSVSWGYCYLDNKNKYSVDIWKGTEFIPLHDERTGIVMAGIRFWQIDTNKPIWVELYEVEGKTSYKIVKDEIEVIEQQRKYIIKVAEDISGRVELGSDFNVLPIFPLYANEKKKSEFTTALKSKLDLYDIIMSDFGNNLEDSQDVYWVLKNYQGQDINEFLTDFKYYKTIKVDELGDATPQTLDVPYEARKEALAELRRQIYEGSMALDTSILTGGSITNVVIKAMMMDLDLKTDSFEWQVVEFISNIVDLYLEYTNQSIEYEINFIRRGIVNDTEIIDNIYKMREDISHETSLRLNPYIEKVNEELDLIDSEGLNKFKIEEV